jgi:hypothetical protein
MSASGAKRRFVAGPLERVGRLVQVEPIRAGDHREPVARRRMQHHRLGGLLRRQLRRSRLAGRRLSAGMVDHIEAHAVLAKVNLELFALGLTP